MKFLLILAFLFSFLYLGVHCGFLKPALQIKNLKCDYLVSPINIDRPDPRFSWELESDERGQKQTAYQIIVSSSKNGNTDLWDSGKIISNHTSQIHYQGDKLHSNTQYFWQVRVWDKNDQMFESESAQFCTALLDSDEWTAQWIGAGPETESFPEHGFFKSNKDFPELVDKITHNGRSLLLRNEFECPEKIKSARVHVTGLGYYELYLNGARIGDHVLAPAKTNYRKEVLYDTYDVTDELKKGVNAVGIHLGNGWFNPYKKWWRPYRMQWFGAKRALFQLHVEYTNGDKAVFASNDQWKQTDGPVLFNCIYDGEIYDASEEIPNWASADFDDSGWNPVTLVEAPGGELVSHTMQPIKVTQMLDPVKVHEPAPGTKVYDMGQNFAGWARITVNGKKGTKLHLQFAEDSHDDGSIDVTSNEHAKARATYILKGDGPETYEPRFTFYGFKYVEVTADPELPEIKELKGCVVHTAAEQTGTFECGNEIINKIHNATVWSTRSNMIGYPLDCPQRDERLGWFGDAQVTVESIMFNFDMPQFYDNWLSGIRSNQDEKTGDIPIISPRPYIWDEGVEWSSTYIVIAWYYYLYYGDKDILAKHYASMKRYMEFLKSISDNYILPQGWIGDWGSLVKGWNEGEPESVPTAFYFWNARTLAKIAAMLNENEDAAYFATLAEDIKEVYNRTYFDPVTFNYNDGSQMANAFPLFLGLAPQEHKKETLDNLIHDIVGNNDGHLTTGVLGSKYMIDALSQQNRADIAWLLATQTGYPSWSDMVEKYTTMCEFWTLKQSHNHVMTGSIDAFFYKTLAGINVNEDYPGCERLTIKPYIPDSLHFVKASVETIRGPVRSEWHNSADELRLKIHIPANTTADVLIPANEPSRIFENNKPADQSPGVQYEKNEDGRIHYVVESGSYEFVVRK